MIFLLVHGLKTRFYGKGHDFFNEKIFMLIYDLYPDNCSEILNAVLWYIKDTGALMNTELSNDFDSYLFIFLMFNCLQYSVDFLFLFYSIFFLFKKQQSLKGFIYIFLYFKIWILNQVRREKNTLRHSLVECNLFSFTLFN